MVALASDLATWQMATFAAGLVLIAALVAARVPGALLLGVLLTTAIAIAVNAAFGDGDLWAGVGPDTARLTGDVVAVPSFELVGGFSFDFVTTLGAATAVTAVLAVMLSDFFDRMGTVVAVGEQAGMLDERGRLPGVGRVLFVDSLGAAAGAPPRPRPTPPSWRARPASRRAGRTGLTAVVVGGLFLLALFFSPWRG